MYFLIIVTTLLGYVHGGGLYCASLCRGRCVSYYREDRVGSSSCMTGLVDNTANQMDVLSKYKRGIRYSTTLSIGTTKYMPPEYTAFLRRHGTRAISGLIPVDAPVYYGNYIGRTPFGVMTTRGGGVVVQVPPSFLTKVVTCGPFSETDYAFYIRNGWLNSVTRSGVTVTSLNTYDAYNRYKNNVTWWNYVATACALTSDFARSYVHRFFTSAAQTRQAVIPVIYVSTEPSYSGGYLSLSTAKGTLQLDMVAKYALGNPSVNWTVILHKGQNHWSISTYLGSKTYVLPFVLDDINDNSSVVTIGDIASVLILGGQYTHGYYVCPSGENCSPEWVYSSRGHWPERDAFRFFESDYAWRTCSYAPDWMHIDGLLIPKTLMRQGLDVDGNCVVYAERNANKYMLQYGKQGTGYDDKCKATVAYYNTLTSRSYNCRLKGGVVYEDDTICTGSNVYNPLSNTIINVGSSECNDTMYTIAGPVVNWTCDGVKCGFGENRGSTRYGCMNIDNTYNRCVIGRYSGASLKLIDLDLRHATLFVGPPSVFFASFSHNTATTPPFTYCIFFAVPQLPGNLDVNMTTGNIGNVRCPYTNIIAPTPPPTLPPPTLPPPTSHPNATSPPPTPIPPTSPPYIPTKYWSCGIDRCKREVSLGGEGGCYKHDDGYSRCMHVFGNDTNYAIHVQLGDNFIVDLIGTNRDGGDIISIKHRNKIFSNSFFRTHTTVNEGTFVSSAVVLPDGIHKWCWGDASLVPNNDTLCDLDTMSHTELELTVSVDNTPVSADVADKTCNAILNACGSEDQVVFVDRDTTPLPYRPDKLPVIDMLNTVEYCKIDKNCSSNAACIDSMGVSYCTRLKMVADSSNRHGFSFHFVYVLNRNACFFYKGLDYILEPSIDNCLLRHEQ